MYISPKVYLPSVRCLSLCINMLHGEARCPNLPSACVSNDPCTNVEKQKSWLDCFSLSLSRPTRVDVVGGRCLTLAHIGTTSVTRCWNKRSPNFTISSLKSNHSLYWKGMFFKVPQKVNKYLCNFSEKLCQQNLSKIAQSGHTGTFISKLFK